jgi:molybdopterin-guanine dinucleotide biosynthesis protein A
MTTHATSAAIVLAGGRSSRFGRDKLAEEIDGQTMLERAIGAVRPVVDEVLVVVAPDAMPTLPDGVRPVHDDHAFEGPLAGVATGLGATDADLVLVVAGDMPWMVSAILARLLRRLEEPGVAAVVLETAGDARPLPMAVRRADALTSSMSLLASGERRLRTLPSALHAVAIPETEWRADDPTGAAAVDVDRPDDLA